VQCVRRAVEGIDDDDDVAIGLVQAALLRQHADACTEQHLQRGPVGCDVAVVLTWMRTTASEPPIGDIAQRGHHRRRGRVEKGAEPSI
jgi:hypothetical protein